MSDTPKFTVIDRRKFKAEEEKENAQTPAPELPATTAPVEPSTGPRLVVKESRREAAPVKAPEAASEAGGCIGDASPTYCRGES